MRPELAPVLDFLRVRSPAAWLGWALRNVDTLLLDHAALELKAARQAQKLIWRYGAASGTGRSGLDEAFRRRLVHRMSRLAREELRHFEQVVTLIEQRGGRFALIPPSDYASGLHALARKDEPAALVDSLVIGAVIEARSCERFACLADPLGESDPALGDFYRSLLRSESRHFADYLGLAKDIDPAGVDERVAAFLARDLSLIETPSKALRFHSGPPAALSA